MTLHINTIYLIVTLSHNPAQEKQFTLHHNNTRQIDISLLSFLAALDYPLVAVWKFFMFSQFFSWASLTI